MARKDMFVMIFTGNLMAEPVMRYTPAGAPTATLIVACNDTYKTAAGETVETLVKLKVMAWNKQAENCNQYLHKGDQVLVHGRLVTSEQEGPNRGGPHIWQVQDGSPRADHEVKLTEIKFLQKVKGNAAVSAPASPANTEETPDKEAEEEFSF